MTPTTPAVSPPEESASVDSPQAPDPASFFVVPADVLNAIVGYLMEQPWRFTNQLLQALNGVRSLDEYLPSPDESVR